MTRSVCTCCRAREANREYGFTRYRVPAVPRHSAGGRWMQQAGFPDVPRARPTVTATEPGAGPARQPDEVLADLGRSMPLARLR